ncbi:hypothetical protein BT96DRAFT_994875 [Gymnopus androsaceus JB14]|uniref:Uncharacterized protein n=1 Tax=Gymnopus androsaceus JB14 TaxID=1447944 RepID=A0A6A4HLF4_9AGAR|nr:hypothetical protein BT96DRAFT_994875 [Gymnopus androsaceus JB14]
MSLSSCYTASPSSSASVLNQGKHSRPTPSPPQTAMKQFCSKQPTPPVTTPPHSKQSTPPVTIDLTDLPDTPLARFPNAPAAVKIEEIQAAEALTRMSQLSIPEAPSHASCSRASAKRGTGWLQAYYAVQLQPAFAMSLETPKPSFKSVRSKIFKDVKVSSSTFYDHRKQWLRAFEAMQSEFIQVGMTEAGCWTHFMQAVSAKDTAIKASGKRNKQEEMRHVVKEEDMDSNEINGADQSDEEEREDDFDESGSDKENESDKLYQAHCREVRNGKRRVS